MEQWRRVIGHDGYLLADLRLATSEEGGRGRAVQSGCHAQWWLEGREERWVGSGPLDVIAAPSIKPGTTGTVRIHPMTPREWQGIAPGAVLHLRERVGQTPGVATVRQLIAVPDHADLNLDNERLRPGAVRLVTARPSRWGSLRALVAGRG